MNVPETTAVRKPPTPGGGDARDRGLWLRCFQPCPDPAVRLICFPHAGGSASFFFPLSRLLSPRVEVYAVQYPGRQDRRTESCLTSVESLAEGVFGALAGLTDRPFALFGHSLGASVAFEVARSLEGRLDAVPSALFASARSAPSRNRGAGIHLLDDDGLISEIGRLNGTDARILDDQEMLRAALPAIRSDYRAAETYRYRSGPPLRCPIVALIGSQDLMLGPGDVDAWRGHTTAGYTLHEFPGGHFYLSEHGPRLAGIVAGHLLPGTPHPG